MDFRGSFDPRRRLCFSAVWPTPCLHIFADRGLTVGGGVEVISRRGEDFGVCGTGIANSLPDDEAFVDSNLARGILDEPGCEFADVKGTGSVTSSRGADRFGTGG